MEMYGLPKPSYVIEQRCYGGGKTFKYSAEEGVVKVDSTYALLDVKKGRRKLAGRVERLREGEGIPVVIHGRIVSRWGGDDGTSIEFQVAVDSCKEVEVEK